MKIFLSGWDYAVSLLYVILTHSFKLTDWLTDVVTKVTGRAALMQRATCLSSVLQLSVINNALKCPSRHGNFNVWQLLVIIQCVMCISRHGYWTRRLRDVGEVLECLPLRFDMWKMSSYASESVGRRLPLRLKAVEYAWPRNGINDYTQVIE